MEFCVGEGAGFDFVNDLPQAISIVSSPILWDKSD